MHMTDGFTIRPAEDRDLDAILAIHNEQIRNSTAIWTDQEADRAEREAWLADRHAAGHPVIVADIDGVAVGYASYGQWRPKIGYRQTVENSVYIDTEHRGQGIGRALMVALIDEARVRGMHVMVAGIDASNDTSIRLHESLGFSRAGLFPEVGRKFDRWLDLAILQLNL